MLTSAFEKGMRVRFIPNHVEWGDVGHKDVQHGCVSSVNDTYVFVKLDLADVKMITGDEPYTAQASFPINLDLL